LLSLRLLLHWPRIRLILCSRILLDMTGMLLQMHVLLRMSSSMTQALQALCMAAVSISKPLKVSRVLVPC